MKTGTEFNLAQIIESLSATPSVSRVIPGVSADAGDFSRILDAAMEATARSESGMTSSAISESGAIMPLSDEGALQADAGKSADAAGVAIEPPLQLATINFLSGRTILITPVDVAEPAEQGLPQWWQDESPPHPAQSLSGVMALVHGNAISNQREPKPFEWDDDFDIHSAGDREAANVAAPLGEARSGLDAGITSMLAWQQLKQAAAVLPREPAATPTLTSTVSYLYAERSIAAAATADPAAVPSSEAAVAAGAALSGGASAGSTTETSPVAEISLSQSASPIPGEVAAAFAVSGKKDLPVAPAAPLGIPTVRPQPLWQQGADHGVPVDLSQGQVGNAELALVEGMVTRDAAPTVDAELRQQRSSPLLGGVLAESSHSSDPGTGNSDTRGHSAAPGNSSGENNSGESRSVADPRREAGAPAPVFTAAVAEPLAATLQGEAQAKSLSVEAADFSSAPVVRDPGAASGNLQAPLETAAASRPVPVSSALRQEFADTLLNFATEQLELPEQGAVTRLRLEVSPPELGNLEIEVTQGADSLDVRIFARDDAAVATLRESEHVMRELLTRNDSTRITIGIDVATRDGSSGRRREQEPDQAPPQDKPEARMVKIRLNQDNNFDIYV
jgi:flagellar hook-length control protein FliK